MDSNFLISLIFIFSSSVAGSFHCGAMCRTFACIASDKNSCSKNQYKNPFYYHVGRLITYIFLTIIFYSSLSWASYLSNIFALKYIILLICLTILLIDLIIEFPKVKSFVTKLTSVFSFTKNKSTSKISKKFLNLISITTTKQLSNNSVKSSLFLGITTGLIPCSWLYIYVAMAGRQNTITQALLLIFCFWLGTIPILIIVGKFSSILAFSLFPRIKYISRTLLICATIIAINMRAPFFSEQKASCHMCATKEVKK